MSQDSEQRLSKLRNNEVSGMQELVALGRETTGLIRRGPMFTETNGAREWAGRQIVETGGVSFEFTEWEPGQIPPDATSELMIWSTDTGRNGAMFISFVPDDEANVIGVSSIHLPGSENKKDEVPLLTTQAQEMVLVGDRITESAVAQAKIQLEKVKTALSTSQGAVFEVLNIVAEPTP